MSKVKNQTLHYKKGGCIADLGLISGMPVGLYYEVCK